MAVKATLGFAAVAMLLGAGPVSAEPGAPDRPSAAPTSAAMELSLEQAIAMALGADSGIDRVERSAKIASLQVKNARTAYYPTANVGVQASQSAQGSAFRAEGNNYNSGFTGNFISGVTVNANLPIDLSGTIGRQVEQARLGEDLASLGLEQARRDAVFTIQIAYWNALRGQQAAVVDRNIYDAVAELRKEAQSRLPTITPYLDVELATLQQTTANSQSAAELGQDGLKQALQLPLETPLILVTAVPDPPLSSAAEREQQQSFDIAAADLRVRQAELAANQARDMRKPSLSVGAYGTQSFGGRFISDTGKTTTRNYGLTVSLNLPLLSFDAGRDHNSRRTADLLAEQARRDRDAQQRSAELDIRQARAAYDRAMKRLGQLPDPAAARDIARSAGEALFLVDPASAPGLLAQVSNARSAWRGAETAVVDAKVEAIIAALRLQRALGRQ